MFERDDILFTIPSEFKPRYENGPDGAVVLISEYDAKAYGARFDIYGGHFIARGTIPVGCLGSVMWLAE